MYRCPACKSPRIGESRVLSDGQLVLHIKYEKGCFITLVREGNIWKLRQELCNMETERLGGRKKEKTR